MKHLLSLESLSRDEILAILDLAVKMKATRGRHEFFQGAKSRIKRV